MKFKRAGMVLITGLIIAGLFISIKEYKKHFYLDSDENTKNNLLVQSNNSKPESQDNFQTKDSASAGADQSQTGEKSGQAPSDQGQTNKGHTDEKQADESSKSASNNSQNTSEAGKDTSDTGGKSIAVPKEVANKANSIAKSEVKAEDFFTAASTVLGKLSLSEMKYLFNSARDDYWVSTSVEDIEKARKILFDKLSQEDLDTLRQLGKKYGRSMTILDPDIDIAEVKKKQMEKKQAERKD